MNSRFLQAVLALASATAVCAAQAREPTRVRKEVSLKAGGKEITAVILENTHDRSYTDASSGRRCDLTSKADGVIWRIVCEGKDIAAGDVSLQDERGRKFTRTCWNSQGTVFQIDATGKRTGGGPQTEFLAFGPDDSKEVKIAFGDAAAEIEVAKIAKEPNHD